MGQQDRYEIKGSEKSRREVSFLPLDHRGVIYILRVYIIMLAIASGDLFSVITRPDAHTTRYVIWHFLGRVPVPSQIPKFKRTSKCR